MISHKDLEPGYYWARCTRKWKFGDDLKSPAEGELVVAELDGRRPFLNVHARTSHGPVHVNYLEFLERIPLPKAALEPYRKEKDSGGKGPTEEAGTHPDPT